MGQEFGGPAKAISIRSPSGENPGGGAARREKSEFGLVRRQAIDFLQNRQGKSLEILGKSLEKAWKRLGKVWNSLEMLARQASAHRDRGIGLALRGAGFAVSLSGGGLKTIGVVRCDQPRALDFSARRARLLERAPPEIVEEVLARLAPLFE